MTTLAGVFDQFDDKFYEVIAVGILAVFFGVWIVSRHFHLTAKSRHREQTRREIAAYVAEGSITPGDATRLLAAGTDNDAIEHLLKQVAEGEVDSDTAERLIHTLRPGAKPS
ncbi:MAG: hypothetical protein RBS39_09150 [Phycisphaerales bacterium]|nr:hypothetical protein [Phycisphaerales bacterium]